MVETPLLYRVKSVSVFHLLWLKIRILKQQSDLLPDDKQTEAEDFAAYASNYKRPCYTDHSAFTKPALRSLHHFKKY